MFSSNDRVSSFKTRDISRLKRIWRKSTCRIYHSRHIWHIIHLLDRAESDIRFVVQIEADIGRSEAVQQAGIIKQLFGQLLARYLIYLVRENRYWAQITLRPISALPCQIKQISDSSRPNNCIFIRNSCNLIPGGTSK